MIPGSDEEKEYLQYLLNKHKNKKKTKNGEEQSIQDSGT
jgi:hypothetical protein